MKMGTKGLIVSLALGAAVIGWYGGKASSQAYLPPGAKGLVLPAPPAPPSMQLVGDGTGTLFAINQRTGQIYRLDVAADGQMEAVGVGVVSPGSQPEQSAPIPAHVIEGAPPPRPVKHRYGQRYTP